MPTPRVKDESTTREATIAALIEDKFGSLMHGENHPLLTSFSPKERKRILHEVERELWRRREEARLPVLLERLATWDVCQWGSIFCERPDLERKLTPEQRERWKSWLRSRGITDAN